MKNGYIESKRSETDSDSYNIYIYILPSAKNNLNENI